MKQLITTLKEYKETYKTRLDNHLTEYDDYDELHFINSELDYYTICLRTSNIIKYSIDGANGNPHLQKTIYRTEIEYLENKNLKNNQMPKFDFEQNEQVLKLIKDEKFNLTGGYDIEKSKRLNLSFKKIIDFLREIEYKKTIDTIKQPQQTEKTHKETPKHDNIFSNNGFVLFDHILNEYVRPIGKRGRFSDIGYYYWKMYNSETQYLHQKPEAFKKWFFKKYDNEDIGKIKTLTNLTDTNRNKHYSTALDWFKTQNQ